MKLILAISLFTLTMFSACIGVVNPYPGLPPGIWQGQLELQDGEILYFNFELSYTNTDSMYIELINGEERIPVRDISFGRTQGLDDTVHIEFPVFDTYIDAIFKENVMEGHWFVNYRENYAVPFVAYHGVANRFSSQNISPVIELNGSWDAQFEIETEHPYPAYGEFIQEGNRVLGNFITETGDYRYLEGEIQGDKLKLSCFDGSHAFLFSADVSSGGNLIGKFYSGKHYKTNWTAIRSDSSRLASPYELSKALSDSDPVNIQLPNTEGNLISLDDPKYTGKPMIISIMGTWCPNCLDESKFLLGYLDSHPEKSVEIVSIAYERYRDKEKAMAALKRYKEKLNIPYEILYGGYYDKAEVSSSNGLVDKLIAYPTMVFLDSSHRIRKVYTGFYGPATSKHEEFKKEFDTMIGQIID